MTVLLISDLRLFKCEAIAPHSHAAVAFISDALVRGAARRRNVPQCAAVCRMTEELVFTSFVYNVRKD